MKARTLALLMALIGLSVAPNPSPIGDYPSPSAEKGMLA
jgi:hypothetical protein